MLGIDCYQHIRGKLARQYQWCARPSRGQEVMRLVYQNPVRACGRDAQTRERGQQLGEKLRPVNEVDPEKVDHDILFRIAEEFEHFGDAGWCFRVANRDSAFETFVIALR